ncbi:hypothetical protein CIRG_00157 [Coccidioides immitis RMSCC 2394]|uniref:Uncharacterized protein n=1 Tax=Coccidioides immitis RMSCC 2394 TaxID=404692 RepID=A0A0J6XZ45_COCIT|nr:hypothetical protein CIRG_00157 [Coccidioides immitis RMSCC 2394]
MDESIAGLKLSHVGRIRCSSTSGRAPATVERVVAPVEDVSKRLGRGECEICGVGSRGPVGSHAAASSTAGKPALSANWLRCAAVHNEDREAGRHRRGLRTHLSGCGLSELCMLREERRALSHE